MISLTRSVVSSGLKYLFADNSSVYTSGLGNIILRVSGVALEFCASAETGLEAIASV